MPNPEAIVDKIRKLLRLSRDKGASESEAASALAMAQKLMLQHDIKNVEEKINPQAIRGLAGSAGKKQKWHRTVAGAVARLFTCRVVFYSHGLGGYAFVGKPEHVLICDDTFPWVCEQVEALYKLEAKSRSFWLAELTPMQRGNYRVSFKEGCATRIAHRVNKIVADARNEIPEHMALVVIDQSLAEADELLKDIPKAKDKFREGPGRWAGYTAGEFVKLQKEVDSE